MVSKGGLLRLRRNPDLCDLHRVLKPASRIRYAVSYLCNASNSLCGVYETSRLL